MNNNILNYEEIEELNNYRKLGTTDELLSRVKEEDVLKFYYCESKDEYYVGQRVGTMYYAKVNPDTFDLTFFMSRYLPWGECFNGYTYPSEPKEINFSEWMRGYDKKYLI